MQTSRSNLTRWWLAVCAALIIPRLVTLCVPLLAIDEAIYAVFGREILHGAVPYRDLVDYKAPLIFYLYAGCFWIADHLHLNDMMVVHAAHLMIAAGVCAVLYRIGVLLRDATTGWLAAFFYALFSAAYFSKHALATNAEPLMVLPLALGAWCALAGDQKHSPKLDLWSGVFLSLAFLTKYTSGINLALTLGYFTIVRPYFTHHHGKAFVVGVQRSLLCVIGFLLPIAATIFYFYQVNALPEFYFWGWKYNQHYIAQGGSFVRWDYFLLKLFLRTAHVAALGFVVWVLALKKSWESIRLWWEALRHHTPPESLQVLYCVGWFLCTFIPVSMGGRFFYHYYMQFTPPVCTVAAVAAAPYWKNAAKRAWIVGLSLLSVLICMVESTGRLFDKNPRDDKIVAHLQMNSTPADRIFVWGYLPKIIYEAKRRPASRFVFSQFLTGSQPMTHGMDFDPTKPGPSAWQRVMWDYSPTPPPLQVYDTSANAVPEAWPQLFEDLHKNQPLYFIDTAPANIDRYGKYPLSKYPPLEEYVREHYSLDRDFDGVLLYRRKTIVE